MGVGFGVVSNYRLMSGRMMAEHDTRAWLGGDWKALGSNWDTALGTDARRSAQAPDVGPPRAVRNWAQDRAFFLESQIPSLLRRHFNFAMELFGIVVLAQLIDVGIGRLQGFDLFSGKIGWQAILPELMFPFDFAFGLWGGRVAESDAIKPERLSQSGERIGHAAKEQAVVIDVKQQRQAIGTEGLGQEIEVGQ